MRIIRLMLFAAIVSAGLVVPSPASAATVSIATTTNKPVANQTFTISGTVPNKVVRTVLLQRWSVNKWVTYKTGKTTSKGKYAFAAAATSQTSFRAYAPKTKIKKKSYAARVSGTLRIYPIIQSGTITATRPSPGRLTITTTFVPAIAGRTVVLKSLDGTTWTTVDQRTQLANGTTAFTIDAPPAGDHTYGATVTGGGVPLANATQATIPVADALPRVDITTTDRPASCDSDHPNICSGETYTRGTLAADARGSGVPPQTAVTGQFRVRGNSTSWIWPKLSYKVKLDAKAPLLGMPTSKNWVLLANFYDRSMLRTALAFEASSRIGGIGTAGLPWTPKMRFVELWVDGSYRGLYQLGEGIEAESARIVKAKDAFLLEGDSWEDSDPSFTTSRGMKFFFKDPDDPDTTVQDAAAAKVQAAEDAIYAGDTSKINVDSFVDWYLVNELMKNVDSAMNNSIWMVLGADGKVSMGPVWDFDQSAGNRTDWDVNDPAGWLIRRNWYDASQPDNVPSQIKVPEGHWFNQLMLQPAFKQKVEQRWAQVRGSLAGLPAYLDGVNTEVHYAAARNFAEGDGGNGLPLGKTFIEPVPQHVFQGTWDAEVASLRSFIDARITWMNAHITD